MNQAREFEKIPVACAQHRLHQAQLVFLRGPCAEPAGMAVEFVVAWVLDAARDSHDGRFFPVSALAADLASRGVALDELHAAQIHQALAEYSRRQLIRELEEFWPAQAIWTEPPAAGAPPVRDWLREQERWHAGPPVRFAGLARDLRAAFPFGLDALPAQAVWDRVSDILLEEIHSCVGEAGLNAQPGTPPAC